MNSNENREIVKNTFNQKFLKKKLNFFFRNFRLNVFFTISLFSFEFINTILIKWGYDISYYIDYQIDHFLSKWIIINNIAFIFDKIPKSFLSKFLKYFFSIRLSLSVKSTKYFFPCYTIHDLYIVYVFYKLYY